MHFSNFRVFCLTHSDPHWDPHVSLYYLDPHMDSLSFVFASMYAIIGLIFGSEHGAEKRPNGSLNIRRWLKLALCVGGLLELHFHAYLTANGLMGLRLVRKGQ